MSFIETFAQVITSLPQRWNALTLMLLVVGSEKGITKCGHVLAPIGRVKNFSLQEPSKLVNRSS